MGVMSKAELWEKFHEAMGRMSFRVRHQIAGKEVVEDEVLRGATEHATAYPCEIQIDPGELLEKVMSAFDSVESHFPDVELDIPMPPVQPPKSETHLFHGFGSLDLCRHCNRPEIDPHHELAPQPQPSSLPPRIPHKGGVELLPIGVDEAKELDHFVVTVICPCGSRATISAKTMTKGELSFVEDWTKAHDHHAKEAGH